MNPAPGAISVSSAAAETHRRVVAGELEEQRRGQPAQSERGEDADRAADERHRSDLPEHHAAHATAVGAEGHAPFPPLDAWMRPIASLPSRGCFP